MSAIGHNRQGANPTRLSRLFSDDYAPKRPSFCIIVCLPALCYSRLGLLHPQVDSRAAKRGRANPSEPGRLKVIRMSRIGHNRQGANPTQLSRLFSNDYAPKRACFCKIVCLPSASYSRLAVRRRRSGVPSGRTVRAKHLSSSGNLATRPSSAPPGAVESQVTRSRFEFESGWRLPLPEATRGRDAARRAR